MVVGKAVCISELCFLISKMTIAVFVLTQLGGAKVTQCVKEHGPFERTIFSGIFLDLKIFSNYENIARWL